MAREHRCAHAREALAPPRCCPACCDTAPPSWTPGASAQAEACTMMSRVGPSSAGFRSAWLEVVKFGPCRASAGPTNCALSFAQAERRMDAICESGPRQRAPPARLTMRSRTRARNQPTRIHARPTRERARARAPHVTGHCPSADVMGGGDQDGIELSRLATGHLPNAAARGTLGCWRRRHRRQPLAAAGCNDGRDSGGESSSGRRRATVAHRELLHGLCTVPPRQQERRRPHTSELTSLHSSVRM